MEKQMGQKSFKLLLGDGIKKIQPNEYITINSQKKSLYAKRKIKKGIIIKIPPIVGVSLFLKWLAGPSLLIFWSRLNFLMIFRPFFVVKIEIKSRTLSAPKVFVKKRHRASAANIPSPLSCDEKNVVVVTSPNEKIARINRKLSFKGSITSVKTPVIVTRMLCPIERGTRFPFISWRVGQVNSLKISVRKPPSCKIAYRDAKDKR